MSDSTFSEINIIGSNLCGTKHDWEHNLGKKTGLIAHLRKNMIGSTFWEKHDWHHILGKKDD
jgi:hypothetical protein